MVFVIMVGVIYNKKILEILIFSCIYILKNWFWFKINCFMWEEEVIKIIFEIWRCNFGGLVF